jgi:hypothetical protein
MIYCFDLDGTLCTNTNGDYENAKPFYNRIERVNNLYNDNTIIINTARGSKTGINWFDLTESQLKKWGVKYHKLFVGKKIEADIFIDDKAVSDKDFFN